MKTWEDLRKELNFSSEEEALIQLEKDLISAIITIRDERGLSQAELAKLCGMKQPAIARLERGTHSPQLDSLLRILSPLGYTLKIVPLEHY